MTDHSAEVHAGVSAGASLEAGASVGNEYVGCDVRVWVSVETVAEAGASAGQCLAAYSTAECLSAGYTTASLFEAGATAEVK